MLLNLTLYLKKNKCVLCCQDKISDTVDRARSLILRISVIYGRDGATVVVSEGHLEPTRDKRFNVPRVPSVISVGRSGKGKFCGKLFGVEFYEEEP